MNLVNILLELLGDDDDQEKLLIMDFLLIDHVMCTSNLTSAEIKSALCAFGIEEDEQVEGWIKRVIDAFEVEHRNKSQ